MELGDIDIMTNGDHMTKYTFDEQIVSDLHKDAYGFRPKADFWTYWNQSSDDWKQKIWDGLLEDLQVALEQDRLAHEEALEPLRAEVKKNLELGARDEQQALKWIVQSLNPTLQDLWYGGSWVCFELGLAFENAYIFNKACHELALEFEKDIAEKMAS